MKPLFERPGDRPLKNMSVCHALQIVCVTVGLAVSIGLAAAPAAEILSSTSLVSNGDFETDADADHWPEKWERPKTGGSWEEEGGNHFVRLTAAEPGKMVMLYHPVNLPVGVKALEMTWRQRITGLKPGKQAWFDARIMLEFKDASGNKLGGAPPAPNARKSTDGWVERSAKFLVPEGARALEFMPTLFQVETGTFDLDDVVIKPADPAPLQEAAEAAAVAAKIKQDKAAAIRRSKAAGALEKDGTLISNGNFETDAKAAGWPDGWGRLKSGGTWETENGNHFLRMKSTHPGDVLLLYRTFDLPAGVKALELSWRWRITDLKAGKEPHFDARIMMEFKDAAGKKMLQKPSPPYTRASTSGWVERSTKFLVPENALTLEFMPALFQVERGTLDLDDIALKPTDPEPLLSASKAAAEMEKLAYVAPEAPQPAKWPQELHVAGNQVLGRNGKPVWLQGVNVVSLEFLVKGDHVMKSAQVAVDDWKANLIRLPVKEEYWFGNGPGQKDGGKAYRELVDAVITLIANRGAYMLLDLHRFRAPRQEHVEFWKDAAARYKNHPALLFDLFNEPHGTTWEVWRDGGLVTEKKAPADEDAFQTPEEKAKAAKGFQSVGMQALVDAVRATGARNIVVTGGLDWAYDLSGIANGFELHDKDGNGIVYSTHIYPWKRDWKDKVLVVVGRHPVLVGEVGADIKKMSFLPDSAQEDPYTWVPDMLGFIQKHHLHWTAFSFHPAATPVMITGWDYTPTPFWGAFVKRALAGEQFPLTKMR